MDAMASWQAWTALQDRTRRRSSRNGPAAGEIVEQRQASGVVPGILSSRCSCAAISASSFAVSSLLCPHCRHGPKDPDMPLVSLPMMADDQRRWPGGADL
jgi:hypothetical protein